MAGRNFADIIDVIGLIRTHQHGLKKISRMLNHGSPNT